MTLRRFPCDCVPSAATLPFVQFNPVTLYAPPALLPNDFPTVCKDRIGQVQSLNRIHHPLPVPLVPQARWHNNVAFKIERQQSWIVHASRIQEHWILITDVIVRSPGALGAPAQREVCTFLGVCNAAADPIVVPVERKPPITFT